MFIGGLVRQYFDEYRREFPEIPYIKTKKIGV